MKFLIVGNRQQLSKVCIDTILSVTPKCHHPILWRVLVHGWITPSRCLHKLVKSPPLASTPSITSGELGSTLGGSLWNPSQYSCNFPSWLLKLSLVWFPPVLLARLQLAQNSTVRLTYTQCITYLSIISFLYLSTSTVCLSRFASSLKSSSLHYDYDYYHYHYSYFYYYNYY